MDKENATYLKKLARRAEYYQSVRKKAIKYIIDKRLVNNKTLCVNVIIMSALWAAEQQKETLSESDLEIFFGVKSDDESSYLELSLSDQHKGLSLKQLQDLTVQSHRENN